MSGLEETSRRQKAKPKPRPGPVSCGQPWKEPYRPGALTDGAGRFGQEEVVTCSGCKRDHLAGKVNERAGRVCFACGTPLFPHVGGPAGFPNVAPNTYR